MNWLHLSIWVSHSIPIFHAFLKGRGLHVFRNLRDRKFNWIWFNAAWIELNLQLIDLFASEHKGQSRRCDFVIKDTGSSPEDSARFESARHFFRFMSADHQVLTLIDLMLPWNRNKDIAQAYWHTLHSRSSTSAKTELGSSQFFFNFLSSAHWPMRVPFFQSNGNADGFATATTVRTLMQVRLW